MKHTYLCTPVIIQRAASIGWDTGWEAAKASDQLKWVNAFDGQQTSQHASTLVSTLDRSGDRAFFVLSSCVCRMRVTNSCEKRFAPASYVAQLPAVWSLIRIIC